MHIQDACHLFPSVCITSSCCYALTASVYILGASNWHSLMGKVLSKVLAPINSVRRPSLSALLYCPSSIPNVQQCLEPMAVRRYVKLRVLHVRLTTSETSKELSVEHQEDYTSLSVDIDYLVACLQQMVFDWRLIAWGTLRDDFWRWLFWVTHHEKLLAT